MVNSDGELDLSKAPNIEILANPGARGGSGLNTAHFQPAAGKLFPHDPTPDDIKQQQIGDCYLLAGALAILVRKGGPETIAGLMKEVNGRVVVRLYDKTGTAHYVSIEKSIRKNEEKHNGGALWATLLEKAYAAAAFIQENQMAKGKTTGKVQVGYAKLNAGGHSSDVFKTLLGGGADKRGIIGMGGISGAAAPPFQALWSVDETNKLEEHRIAAIVKEVFGGDGKLWNQFLHWRTNYVKRQWKVLLDAYGDIKDGEDVTVRRKALRQEDLAEFFITLHLDRECARKVMEYVAKHRLLPGRRGTGAYTEYQIKVFDRVKKALSEGKPVALGSLKEVAATATGKGKSAGEAVAKGLVGGHAYAVIDFREEPLPPFLKWLRIRNPWGDTGRVYKTQTDKSTGGADATDKPEFDLELNDLTKRFKDLYIGGAAVTG